MWTGEGVKNLIFVDVINGWPLLSKRKEALGLPNNKEECMEGRELVPKCRGPTIAMAHVLVIEVVVWW